MNGQAGTPERPPAPGGRRFTTRAQLEQRRGGRRRFAWAALVALVAVGVAIWLGPSQDEVKDRFEFYGAPDEELRIMPEISIDEGQDAVHQLPKSLQTPPPPSRIEVEQEPDQDGFEPVPKPSPSESKSEIFSQQDFDDAETLDEEQVKLLLPLQSNPDWYIIKMVRPEYPLNAPDRDRRTPIIFVKVEIFVGPDGLVSAALIGDTNGSQVFGDAVLEAVNQWQFGWRVDPGPGRWMVLPWNFRSPYFQAGRGLDSR